MIHIIGPDYALVRDNVRYKIDRMDLPPMVSPSDIKAIEWYRSGVLMPQYPGEDEYSFQLYDVDYPAGGIYYVRIKYEYDGQIKYLLSNEIELEIGTVPRRCSISISSRTYIYVDEGDDVFLTPQVTVEPPHSTVTYSWEHDGNPMQVDTNSLDIVVDSSTVGVYDFIAHGTALGAYDPTTERHLIHIIEKEVVDDTCYQWEIRPLKYRDTGFTWMGFWVINEIIQANRDGFDWEANYTDPRFKYSCQIGIIVNMMNQYDEVCVMNSKNGRRWNKNDLKTRTEDIYYQFT